MSRQAHRCFKSPPARLPKARHRATPPQSRAPGRGGPSPRLRLAGPTFDGSRTRVVQDCQCWELVRSEPGLCWHSPKGTERCHVDFLGFGGTAGVAIMCKTSGPQSTNSCDHFSYFKPLGSESPYPSHQARHWAQWGEPEPGQRPECGHPERGRGRLHKGKGFVSGVLDPTLPAFSEYCLI